MLFTSFIAFIYLALFTSLTSRDTIFIAIVISFLAICLGVLHIFESKKTIQIPKHFPLMLIFVLILQIGVFTAQSRLNPFYYALIMGEGLGYWLIFYNLPNGQQILKNIIIRFSLFYSLIFFIAKIFNINFTNLGSLMFTQETPTRHYYFGEFWAAALLLLLPKGKFGVWIKDKKNLIKIVIPILLGLFFVIYSNSRSLLLAAGITAIYVLFKNGNLTVLKNKHYAIGFILFGALFIFLSLGKTTLFDRPYFLQSLRAFPQNLLGVGMGNFGQIGKIYEQSGTNEMSLSIYTHNIFLEALSGIGIFSLTFLAFLILILKDVFRTKTNIIWGSVVLLILTNFMFSTSYTVPAFVWVFFAALGVFQSGTQKSII